MIYKCIYTYTYIYIYAHTMYKSLSLGFHKYTSSWPCFISVIRTEARWCRCRPPRRRTQCCKTFWTVPRRLVFVIYKPLSDHLHLEWYLPVKQPKGLWFSIFLGVTFSPGQQIWAYTCKLQWFLGEPFARDGSSTGSDCQRLKQSRWKERGFAQEKEANETREGTQLSCVEFETGRV